MLVRMPFSNGTEGDAWQAKWCEYCAHDHGIHAEDGPGCELMLNALVADGSEPINVEAWVAEPDDGQFYLPSRMVCLRFTPCYGDGCHGDPGAADRAQRVADVTAYWRNRQRTA